jgi:hypothetical protein
VAGLQRALPASRYLRPQAFALERERVLYREWFCAGHAARCSACGVPYRWLDAAEVRRRWPVFRLEPGTGGLWQVTARSRRFDLTRPPPSA